MKRRLPFTALLSKLVSLRAPKGRSNLSFEIASVASLPRNDTLRNQISKSFFRRDVAANLDTPAFTVYRLPFKIILLATCYLLLATLIGCEAFVRKFTRKSKNPVEEVMVLAPEEYKGPQQTKEELYRQYFLFWKSWQDELIESLLQNKSNKKKVNYIVIVIFIIL